MSEEQQTQEQNQEQQNQEQTTTTEEQKTQEQTQEQNQEQKTQEPEFVPLTAENLTFPEDMAVNEQARDDFLSILNNRELSPAEQAQKLVDLQTSLAREASETGSKAWDEVTADWVSKVKADPEFGGPKHEATMLSIGKLVQNYGDDDLRDAMNLTGAGNHPAVVRFLAKIAKDFNEGGPVSGTPTNQSSGLDKMYPSMAQKT